LTIAGGTVVAGALVLVSAVLYPAVDANLRGQIDHTLVVAADQAPSVASAFKAKFELAGDEPTFPAIPIGIGSTQLQIVPGPVEAGTSTGFIALTARDVDVASGKAPSYFQDASYKGVLYRVYTTDFPDGQDALVRTAIPESDPMPTLRTLAWLLVGSVVGAGLLAALASRLAARRVLGPVRELTETVERIRATGDLSVKIPAEGRDEIGRLGSAFAAMTAALDDSVGAQRRLVADASHELRTPLTSLTVNLELLTENPTDEQASLLAAEALAQAGELRALINNLVDLARFGEAPFHTEDVRLDLVAERVIARVGRRAPGVSFELTGTPTVVHGDPDALERAVANLVDNAVKWSPSGGRVRVSVTGGTVEVADAGPGIADVDRPYVFDRFYRSPAARAQPGSGLGLAIVRQVAESHGGMAEALPSPRGAVLRMTLPLASVLSGPPDRRGAQAPR
jgi:two-component system sensor histidine kinase MprB